MLKAQGSGSPCSTLRPSLSSYCPEEEVAPHICLPPLFHPVDTQGAEGSLQFWNLVLRSDWFCVLVAGFLPRTKVWVGGPRCLIWGLDPCPMAHEYSDIQMSSDCGVSALAAHSFWVYFWSRLNSRFLSGIVTSLFVYLLTPVTCLFLPPWFRVLAPSLLCSILQLPLLTGPQVLMWTRAQLKGYWGAGTTRPREYALMDYCVNSRPRLMGARTSSSL